MNVIVCLKQVPDTNTEIDILPDSRSIRLDDVNWITNPYDEYGLEEALKLKEEHGGEVTVISVGPKRVEEMLRSSIALGADNAIHINDPAAFDSDSLSTAKILAQAIKQLPFDIIMTGGRGADEDLGVVGTSVAEFLGIPSLSFITKVEVIDNGSKVRVQQQVEGKTLVIESELPALITAQKGLNEPRYASLTGKMKAKKKKIESRSLSDLGINPDEVGSGFRKLELVKITPAPKRNKCIIIEGDTQVEKVKKLVNALDEKGCI